MRAAVIDRNGPPEVLRIQEVDRPVPAPGEILVRVHAAVTLDDVFHYPASSKEHSR